MTAQIRFRDTGGTLRTAARISIRDDGGLLRTARRIRVRDVSNVLRTVWESVSATLSTTAIYESQPTSTVVSTTSCTAAMVGGTAPYTYLWHAADYNYDGINPSTPASASTTFRRSGCIASESYVGDFFCTITDAMGATVDTEMVSVELARS